MIVSIVYQRRERRRNEKTNRCVRVCVCVCVKEEMTKEKGQVKVKGIVGVRQKRQRRLYPGDIIHTRNPIPRTHVT